MHVSSDENMKNIIFSRGKKVEGENFQYLEKISCVRKSPILFSRIKSYLNMWKVTFYPTFQEKSDILPDFSMENSILFYIFRENS